MRHWKAVLTGLMLSVAGVLGCKQQCFLHECDYDHYRGVGLTAALEGDPSVSTILPKAAHVPPPMTVRDTDRPIRYLSLYEAIALALEYGNVGNPSVVSGAGFANDNLVSFTGRGVAGSDSIRVLALDPAIVGADIEAALAKFDTRWTTSMTWRRQDIPVASLIDQFTNADYATFQTGLLKPLPTGGVAGITWITEYTFVTDPPVNVALPGGGMINFLTVNPQYRPRLQFQFEQPLLQNFGAEINQLRATHPGSLLTPFQTASRTEGILITRLRFNQARAEFERNVNILLLNVETAYWNLYGAYWTLFAREQALRQAFEAWRINMTRAELGQVTVEDLAQARQQYEQFRGLRLAALGDVLERERQLRGLLGMPLEDGFRLVPCDTPTLAPFRPDWYSALDEAMALRPELIMARQELKARQLELINQRNLLRPDLRFVSTYDINGLGTALDGPNGALASFARNDFNSWRLGLNLDIPLGYREAHAGVRAARLNLARSFELLKDQEDKAQRQLGLYYRRLIEFHDQIEIQRAQREAAALQMQKRFETFVAGKGTLDLLLESQRVWADALRAEYDAIVQYNNALAGFQFAKGTIQHYDNVFIAEGPLPHCAQVRAVEHARQRTKALVLSLRPEPTVHSACDGPGTEGPCLPKLPAEVPAPLPAVMENQPPLPEHLPPPRPAPR